MAELQSPQHPLEVLPAMLNLMLVQTGKFFKDAASNGPGDLVSARDLLKEVGTSANRRFHEALDELEIECTRAKAVFERDLRNVRAKRAERDRAASILTKPAGVVKQRSPGAGTKRFPPATKEAAKMQDAKVHDIKVEEGAAAQEIVEIVDMKVEDAVMVNGVDILKEKKEIKQIVPEASELGAPTQKAVNGSLKKASPGASRSSKLDNIPVIPKPDQATEKAPSPKTSGSAAAAAPSVVEVSSQEAASQAQEAAPFESMFNDIEQPTNGSSLDFDLGFSNSQDLLNDPVFDNIDLSNTEETTALNATSAEDINTLLPGLENYVNDSGDFSMIDFPTAEMPELITATTNAPPGSTTGAGGDKTGSTGQAPELAPMESNFDDLFGSGDWAGDGDMGDGAMVDFDEDWFKTDG